MLEFCFNGQHGTGDVSGVSVNYHQLMITEGKRWKRDCEMVIWGNALSIFIREVL